MPRPINRPVECWQPIVSASARGLDFMVKHGIKGAVGGGAATMQQGPITAYRDAAARAGQDLKLGENLMLGIFFHLADSKEKAVAALRPLYEEHAKMFAPLGFLPGATPAQVEAISKRGGWKRRALAELEHYMKLGAWFAGHAGGPGRPPEGAGGAISRDGAHQSQHADGHARSGDAGPVQVGRGSGAAGVQAGVNPPARMVFSRPPEDGGERGIRGRNGKRLRIKFFADPSSALCSG